ncbi:MAG: prolipoprotein diacylglyceryl transferase [Lentisphaerae bacterium GWF2_57_35]|nr:MAG: prolipoprotein diacylglyceryl transferase [Lentisphaerae bacterium GWF2_57_35]
MLTALAFMAAVFHWNRLAKRDGRPPEFGYDLGLWMMISGILGARAAYIIANFQFFAAQPLEILRIDKGGLIYYGGFLGASLCLYIMARMRHETLWSLADFAVTGLPLGHAVGRIGCFINGCCFGHPTNSFLGVQYPEGSEPWKAYPHCDLHPTQLYETAFNLLIYGLLLWYYPRKRKDGGVFALYLLTYPIGRFLVEFFRGDERLHWMGLNAAQELSVVLFGLGLLLWAFLPKTRKPAP